MQLDAINTVVVFASLVGLFAVPFLWGFILSETEGLAPRLLGFAVSLVWGVSLLAATFLPSSKTAAAMIVIPAIANNERFQAEASDLYDLAKKGLEKVVAGDPPKKEEP